MLIINHPLNTPFPLPLSIFKLHYLNKGQLRTLLAKLPQCSFKTLEVLEFGEGEGFFDKFQSPFPLNYHPNTKTVVLIFKLTSKKKYSIILKLEII